MVVLELTLTVTCPCDVVKVKVSPFMAAKVPKVPFGPRRWAVVGADVVGDAVVAVEVVVDSAVDDVTSEDADEQATVATNKATAKARPAQTRIIFLRFIFIYNYLPQNIIERSLHSAFFSVLITIGNYTAVK
jgi:hypothetical protein